MGGNALYGYSITTIIKQEKLDTFKLRGTGKFTEKRAWKTGEKLYDDAKGLTVPVILSDAAEDCERLQLWAVISYLNVGDNETTVHLVNIQRVRGNHGRSELTLRSTGNLIKKNFIRPYAICWTPKFLNK